MYLHTNDKPMFNFFNSLQSNVIMSHPKDYFQMKNKKTLTVSLFQNVHDIISVRKLFIFSFHFIYLFIFFFHGNLSIAVFLFLSIEATLIDEQQ